jgi:transcriptional regulator with XRE-family HTH domain
MSLIGNLSGTLLPGIIFFLVATILSTTTQNDSADICRLARLALRLSQAKFAALVGISRWVYGAFERGTGQLSYDEQKLVATVLMAKLSGNIRRYFPAFVPKYESDRDLLVCASVPNYTDNLRPESAPSETAGNRTQNDQT